MSLTDNYIFDLDENVTRTPVSYKNRFGIRIAADLYRAQGLRRIPGASGDHRRRALRRR
jgi:hypothetical protein